MSALDRAIDAGDYDRAALRLAAALLRALEAAPAAREELLALLTPGGRTGAPRTGSARSRAAR